MNTGAEVSYFYVRIFTDRYAPTVWNPPKTGNKIASFRFS